jgi:hypothetical protein
MPRFVHKRAHEDCLLSVPRRRGVGLEQGRALARSRQTTSQRDRQGR